MRTGASPCAIDVHCHLLDKSFDRDRVEVVERAKARNVLAAVEGAQNLEESERAVIEGNDFWYPTAGVHPLFVREEDLQLILNFIRDNASAIVAVGEIGLDFFHARSDEERDLMRSFFRAQAELAQELGLPVVVHSRSAGREAYSLLRVWGVERALLHAFDGKTSIACEGAKAGFFFSIPPSVVRSEQKRKLTRALPLEALMLESDAPVLGPKAIERNEPSNIWVSAKSISEIKGISLEQVAASTTDNATKLFGRLGPWPQ